MPGPLIDYHNGIYAFDAGYVRPLLAAIHLIESEGRAAFVDTANFEVMPQALAALEARGLGTESVDFVILTHIHLDHAGGAGAMMEAFPNAKLVVHPRGARHMIEPTKLMAGVEGVYGRERARRMYGSLIPIAAERIIEAHDNTVLKLGSRELLCIDAPGHAKHHIAIVDRQSSGIFTGDTFGISYRELDVDGRPLQRLHDHEDAQQHEEHVDHRRHVDVGGDVAASARGHRHGYFSSDMRPPLRSVMATSTRAPARRAISTASCTLEYFRPASALK